MSVISGTAIRNDGQPVDYVSVFNWETGRCLSQVKPDNVGVWEFEYYADMTVGITYIADKYKPITHGPYQLVAESILPMDTILHYKFDGDFTDSSNSMLNGTVVDNVTFTDGRISGTLAATFNGGYVSTDAPLQINSNKITISYWLKLNTTSLCMIYEMSTNLDSTYDGLYAYTQSNVINSHNRIATTRSSNIATANVDSTGIWQHIVLTVDRTAELTEIQKIYIDNVLVSKPITGEKFVADDFNDKVLYIGNRADYSFPLNGSIENFRIYNRILSEVERLSLFNE